MMISTHHLAVLAGIAGMPGTFIIATAATVFDPDPSADYCYNEDGISYDWASFSPPAPGYEGCAPICGELDPSVDSSGFWVDNGVCQCFFALGYFGDIVPIPGVGKCPSNAFACGASEGGGNYDDLVCYRAMPDVSDSPSVASSDSPSKLPTGSPSVATSDSSSLLPSGSPSVASDPGVDSCVTHSECKRKGLGKEECKGHHGKNKKCRERKEDCKMFGTKHHGRWSCKEGKKCATVDTDTGEKWGKCIKR